MNRVPSFANWSMRGVLLVSDPVQPRSAYPGSSVKMIRMLGRSASLSAAGASLGAATAAAVSQQVKMHNVFLMAFSCL